MVPQHGLLCLSLHRAEPEGKLCLVFSHELPLLSEYTPLGLPPSRPTISEDAPETVSPPSPAALTTSSQTGNLSQQNGPVCSKLTLESPRLSPHRPSSPIKDTNFTDR